MEGARSGGWALDAAGLLLLGWGVLIAWVSSPPLLRGELLDDGGVSLIGAVLALLHVVAVVGIARRSGWSRGLGIGLAGVGLFGSISVLGLFAGGAGTMLDVDPGAGLVLLAIPAGMAASYLVVLVALLRGRDAFGIRG
jgi:hypothetical protein